MLPVADVVSEVQEWQREHQRPWVEGVEVEVEDVDGEVVFGVGDYGGVDARAETVGVGDCACEPDGVGGYVVIGG